MRDSFDLEDRTIAQKNSRQQKNKDAARARAQELAKQRIGSGTAKKPDTTIAQVKQQNQDKMRANAAAKNQQFQQDKGRVPTPAPTQGKPMPSNPPGMRQQAVGGQQQAAPKKQGLLGRIGSGIKRVAGGVADAATGNRFDFDKRGGQRPPRPAGQAAGGAVAARGGNVRGAGARANRAGQAAGGGAVASSRPVGQAAGRGAVASSRPVGQAAGGGAAARPAGQAAGGGAQQQQQQQSSNRVRRPVSPLMQQKLNRIGVGTRAAQAVQKANPQPGQTVTTKQNAQGGTTATLTGSAGSLQKNKQKANRVANAMNQQGANVSVGKISDF